MLMQEPKVEFVPIDLSQTLITQSGCPDWLTQTPVGGGQRCFASQEQAVECADWEEMIPDWGDLSTDAPVQ